MIDTTPFSYTSCFRGGQGWLRHHAYLRLSKVYFLLELLRKHGTSTSYGDIFDYGFGAGTFFRYCGNNCRLFGVEVDPRAVEQVSLMLKRRKQHCELDVVDPANWRAHPLLERKYDVVVCSHVLEHLDEPVGLLEALRNCLKPGGVIVAIVPINEIRDNPQHVQTVTRAVVGEWTRSSGLQLINYEESDTLSYPIQPLFTSQAGLRHACAQAVSVGLGLAASVAGPKGWATTSRFLQRSVSLKPGQAGFVMSLP